MNETAPAPLPKGSRIEGEYSADTDPDTGVRVHRLTSGDGINHAFFFLTSSFRPHHPDEIAYVTHRGGCPQICLFDFGSRSARVLTDRDDIHAFSPAFAPDGSRIYFTTRAGAIASVDIETGGEREHFRLDGAGLGECALSGDGRWIVSAFKRGDKHGLLVLDTATDTGSVLLEKEMKIIHPQFHPADNTRIIFAGDPAPRLWTIPRDGGAPECLYDNPPTEFIVHESFLGRSDDLIFAIWPYRLARMNLRERKIRTLLEINAWHMVSDPEGAWIVSDTAHPDRGLLLIDPGSGRYETLCHPEASCRGSQWEKDHPAGPEVWAAIRGESGENLSWMEMKADTVYGPQHTHPHPAFDREGNRVSFTSDRAGSADVYVVEIGPVKDRLCQERSAAQHSPSSS